MHIGRWMAITLGLLMACAGAIAAEPGVAPLDTMPPLIRDVGPCLVQVVGVFDGNRRIAGSGFLVSPEGHVLTSAKAIERATEVFICAPVLGDLLLKAREIDTKKESDISLLKADLPKGTPCAKIYETVSFGPGDSCYALGLAGDGKKRATGGVKAGILGYREFPGRGRAIQFDRTLPPSFLGGPVLSNKGVVLGMVVCEPPGATGGAGWGVPISGAKELLELNGVSYKAEYSLWSYMTWGMMISFLIVALLVYGAYTMHVWQTHGKKAALKRLPAKRVALCVFASGLFHGIVFLVILVKQQEWGVGVAQPDLTEVGVFNVGEPAEGIGLPDAVTPAPARPVIVTKLPAEHVPVQKVDVSPTLQEKVKETVKNVGEGAERSDAEAEAAARAEHEGVVTGARAGARGRGKASAGLKDRLDDLMKKLSDAESGGGGKPGPAGPAAERAARRARWTIMVSPKLSFFQFIDTHKAELATCSADAPDTLFYLSDLTGAMTIRAGRVSQEPRMHWVPVGVDLHREEEEAAFRSAGRPIGQNDPVIVFFPELFEDMLARLEKQYREERGLKGTPKHTTFEVKDDFRVEAIGSD